MFPTSCFERWLDIPNVDEDPLLLHYVFCHEVVINPQSQVEEWFLRLGVTSCLSGRNNFVSSSASGLVTIFLLLHLRRLPFPCLSYGPDECLGQIRPCYEGL